MEQPLWAPWRMEFIDAKKPKACVFCELPAAPASCDRRNLIAHRSAQSFCIMNKYPYNSGHVLVVPRAHVADLSALSQEAFVDLHEELRLAIEVVKATYCPEGINVGMNLGKVAGAGIADHMHYHIVPRWGGDTNFMPVLASTKVMVEHLETSLDRLAAGFEALTQA